MQYVADPARAADRVRFFRVLLFKDLPEDDLVRIASALRERAVPEGEAILVEGGPPGEASTWSVWAPSSSCTRTPMWPSSPREIIGHPTLLTGLAPEFTVRAREDSLLYCIPRDEAVGLIGRPSGLQWMAANLRERLLQAAGTMRALPDVRALPVTSVTRSKPLFCDPETTAREAAQVMIAEKRSAILVRGPGGRGMQGIVTDVDLRNKVVVGHVSRHAPVTEIMSAPVHTIGAGVLAPEASIAMMAAGVNHLPVLDDDGEVVGILSASNLMSLEARSPFALRREIMAARSDEELIATAADVPKLFLDLMTAHLDAPSVTRVLTVLHDALTTVCWSSPSTGWASLPCRSRGWRSAARHARSSRWRRTRTTGWRSTTPTTRPWPTTSVCSRATSTPASRAAACRPTLTACSPAAATGACRCPSGGRRSRTA